MSADEKRAVALFFSILCVGILAVVISPAVLPLIVEILLEL